MKKLIFASVFSLLGTFAFAQDMCTASCHASEHKCTAACHKNGGGHVANHGEKGHMCTKATCKHNCSAECKKA